MKITNVVYRSDGWINVTIPSYPELTRISISAIKKYSMIDIKDFIYSPEKYSISLKGFHAVIYPHDIASLRDDKVPQRLFYLNPPA